MRHLITSILAINFIFALGILSIQAQDATETITVEEMREMIRDSKVPVYQAKETKGSPYFNDEFVEGSITFKNGNTTNVLPLRFNAYSGTVQIKDGNNILETKTETIQEFKLYLSDGIIPFRKGYDASRLDEDEFVAVLADGNAKFLVKYSVSYHEDVSGYGVATQVEEYIQSENYYTKFGEEEVDRIKKLNKRRVMRAFPSHEEQLEDFANQNNLQFEKVKDVTELFKYYNSLAREQTP